MMLNKIMTLFELNSLIKEAIETGTPDTYMVTAEISSFSINQNGHCYLELVERDEKTIIAKMRATIWSYSFRKIASQFRAVAGTELQKGLKVLVYAEVSFHELYGLSLNITDIDPSYTIGEMTLRRKEILERLTKEGLLKRNKELDLPSLPLDLAIISSPKAAGYEDFMNHISNNPYGYSFQTKLFRSVMQGEKAESSILSSLSEINEKAVQFDLIVLIRGGGGEADLHCFDSYGLGKAIALSSLPVISGIGHLRDRTIVDEVSHTSVKTPTAAADIVIQAVREFEVRLETLTEGLSGAASGLLEERLNTLIDRTRNFNEIVNGYLQLESRGLDGMASSIYVSGKVIPVMLERLRSRINRCHSLATYRMGEQARSVKGLSSELGRSAGSLIKDIRSLLDGRELSVKHLDPRNVLKRGYSITTINGRSIKNTKKLSTGDIIDTALFSGALKSKITEVITNDEEKADKI